MAKNRPSHVSKPVYPGGITAMRKFIAQHLAYPEQAKAAKVSGTVTIRYSLDYRGKVVAAKVKKGLGFGCDEEAVRVVKLMRFSVPQARKKKVRVHQDINIHFKLSQTSTAPRSDLDHAPATAPQSPTPAGFPPPPTTINYVTNSGVKENKASKIAEPKKASTSYQYTIKW